MLPNFHEWKYKNPFASIAHDRKKKNDE